MSIYRKFLIAAAISTASLLSVAAHAQAVAKASELTDGEVRKIDKDNRKITLKHGEIKNLDMPAMTMVFRVSESVTLEKVQAGEKVRFKAVNEGGKLTVTEIQPAP